MLCVRLQSVRGPYFSASHHTTRSRVRRPGVSPSPQICPVTETLLPGVSPCLSCFRCTPGGVHRGDPFIPQGKHYTFNKMLPRSCNLLYPAETFLRKTSPIELRSSPSCPLRLLDISFLSFHPFSLPRPFCEHVIPRPKPRRLSDILKFFYISYFLSLLFVGPPLIFYIIILLPHLEKAPMNDKLGDYTHLNPSLPLLGLRSSLECLNFYRCLILT